MTETVGSILAASLQRPLSLLEPILSVVSPAEAVEIGAVAGLDDQRTLDQRDRFVELLSALGQHVTERVQRIGVFRILGNHLTEHRLGFVIFLLALQRRAELQLDHGFLGELRDRRLQRPDRIVALAAFLLRSGQPDFHQRVRRRKGTSLPEHA